MIKSEGEIFFSVARDLGLTDTQARAALRIEPFKTILSMLGSQVRPGTSVDIVRSLTHDCDAWVDVCKLAFLASAEYVHQYRVEFGLATEELI